MPQNKQASPRGPRRRALASVKAANVHENGKMHPPVVMTFAASDPTAGAGLQADALTIAALGAHPTTIVTGLTVQDTAGVTRFEPLSADWIVDQAAAVLADMQVSVFKTGVLGSVEVVEAVAHIAFRYPDIPLVVDPVMASGRGDDLSRGDVLDAMRKHLLPKVTLLTPNLPEAFTLAGKRLRASAAKALLEMGCKHILLTGTHDEHTEQVVNQLFSPEQAVEEFLFDRLAGQYHGSGCTLASACAAAIANGQTVREAVETAQNYTWQTLAHAWNLGRAQAIPDRFFWLRNIE
jgi:hydroxymethylpyrimidine/phosphomethylpyrimidine kinase